MSDLLVPIAISSQLDVTGEERIHAAKYTANARQVRIPPTLTLSGDLVGGTIGDAVSYQYTATGGYGGNVFTISSGALPSGLSLSSSGLVTGTTTASGVFTWTVTVTDSHSGTDDLADTATIADTLASAILADSPILYWKLNETSGTVVTDYSGFGRHGTTIGSPTKSSTGLTLTSTAHGVTYPGSGSGSALDVGSDTTWAIEAIVTRSGNGGSVWEQIAGQFRSPSFGYMNSLLALNGTGTDLGKPIGQFTDSGGLTAVAVTGPTALANSVRTHLMIVRDGGSGGLGTLRLYINGTQVAANSSFVSTEVGPVSNGAEFVVGSDTSAAGYFPNSYGLLAKVENVVVYDTAPSAARVLYHAQLAGLA